MKQERTEFALRLKAAMTERGIKGPTALADRFNTFFPGEPIVSQTASGWLRGKFLPEPDKMRALAKTVGRELAWLRDGDGEGRKLRQEPPVWHSGANLDDVQTIEAFLALPDDSRELIGKLVVALGDAKRVSGGKR